MAYRVVVKMGSSAFFVPAEAAENLKLCTATQLKLLLLAFSRGFGEISPEAAAEELGISLYEAKDNLDYWVNRGILESDFAVAPAAVPSPISEISAPQAEERPKAKALEPKLTMRDVQKLKAEDHSIAFVLAEAERILGKTFTTADTETVVWLVSFAGIPPEVLVTVMEYCAGIDKRNLRYIQKTALAWFDSGIDTVEAAEEKILVLNEMTSWEGCVKRALEIYGRSLSTKETEFCEAWRLYKISEELIHFAYEKCIDQTGKRSFPYINKILMSWHQKGFKTVEEACAENKPQSEISAPSFDIDELERQMLAEDCVI